MEAYLKRAEKLHNRMASSDMRVTLAYRLLRGVCDGEKDSHLRDRAVDRLVGMGKMVNDRGHDRLADCATFRDVHDAIAACSRKFGDSDSGDEYEEEPDDLRGRKPANEEWALQFTDGINLPRNASNRQLFDPKQQGAAFTPPGPLHTATTSHGTVPVATRWVKRSE